MRGNIGKRKKGGKANVKIKIQFILFLKKGFNLLIRTK